MKVAFFSCFAIMLYALAVTSRASETSHTSNNRETHATKHLASAPETNSESSVAVINGNSNKFELETKNFTSDVEKNQRGKGSNGGGSLTRRPQPYSKNSAATLKRRISIFTSATDVISSLPFFLVLPFIIP